MDQHLQLTVSTTRVDNKGVVVDNKIIFKGITLFHCLIVTVIFIVRGFEDARQDIAAYHQMWTALMEAGGGVELNEMSDIKVQVMPSGDVVIATSFIDNRTRSPDETTTTLREFETDVWQKIDGKWKIISMHYSEILP